MCKRAERTDEERYTCRGAVTGKAAEQCEECMPTGRRVHKPLVIYLIFYSEWTIFNGIY